MGRKRKSQDEPEQGELIEVGPENAPAIKRAARAYLKAAGAFKDAKEIKKEKKCALLELVKAEELTPLEDGVIEFSVNGLVIKITPSDEKISVSEKADESEVATAEQYN